MKPAWKKRQISKQTRTAWSVHYLSRSIVVPQYRKFNRQVRYAILKDLKWMQKDLWVWLHTWPTDPFLRQEYYHTSTEFRV